MGDARIKRTAGRAVFLLFSGLLSCLLAACDQDTGNSFSPATPAVARTRLTALVWAPDWPQEMHRIADEFHREHPDITVDVQFMIGNSVEENLKPKIATRNLPDLVSVNPNAYSAELADQGILADVGDTAAWNNMLELLKPDWTSRHAKRYGISGGVAATLVYYNKEMFRQAGIATLPANFEEFLAACAALRKAGFTPMVWTGAFPNTLANGPFSFGFANNIVTRHPADWKARIADGSLDLKTGAAVDIFAKIKLIADKGYLQRDYMNTSYDEGIHLFTEGRAAMAFEGTWSAGALMHGKDFSTGVFMPPWNAPGETIVPVIGSETGFAVCETRNKKAALQFLEFIYGKGFTIQQNKRQNIAPLKLVPGKSASDPQIIDYVQRASQAPVTAGPYYSYLPTNTIALLHPLLQDVLFGKKTPRQAALALNASIRHEARTENK
ncbi:ABC transporter substrate-binding protein [Herbaspirillum sp. RV1423]|uniref:ABC transporter substrate-binding protein n=1 Tax=Herbaspirillum sp. RV1423 TaxID=1443993 RepID=UPI0004B1F7AA|nr:extracellular solute-binding protein [Herbaspirillum sp. RV1423]